MRSLNIKIEKNIIEINDLKGKLDSLNQFRSIFELEKKVKKIPAKNHKWQTKIKVKEQELKELEK